MVIERLRALFVADADAFDTSAPGPIDVPLYKLYVVRRDPVSVILDHRPEANPLFDRGRNCGPNLGSALASWVFSPEPGKRAVDPN
jgi:hypothetical protein